jgi:hypothetical protein
MTGPLGFLLALIVAAPLGLAAEMPAVPAAPCEGPEARWPQNVRFVDGLDRHASRMLQQSATVRRQCRAIAAADDGLYVRVRVNVLIAERSYRARSVVHKTVSGRLVAFVDIGGRGDPTEWIAHEFEHVIEQVEGVCLETMSRHARGAWVSADHMFESARAIQVGRRVRHELLAQER